jgi:hypothetical protein
LLLSMIRDWVILREVEGVLHGFKDRPPPCRVLLLADLSSPRTRFRLPGASVYRVDLSATVSELDEDKDSTIDYTEIKAEPLREIRV